VGEDKGRGVPGRPRLARSATMTADEMRPLGSLERVSCARRPRVLGLSFVLAMTATLVAAGAAAAGGAASAHLSAAFAAYEWQYAATHADLVPAPVLRAARSVTIAVVDTGADVTVPALAGKAPHAYDASARGSLSADLDGHGTFVASLAAGVAGAGDGMAGFGGDAKLLVEKVANADVAPKDVDVAAAIVDAVDRGARIVNLSLSGPTPSILERSAIVYAVQHGVLVVVAAGNGFLTGNRPQYPAAFLPSLRLHGGGGAGLAVAASTADGVRAGFSSTGPYVSLAAPGENVFGALGASTRDGEFIRVAVPGAAGTYGIGSGTSFAAPEVSGTAALVWAADPSLTAAQVATILEQTASGGGVWNDELGYGVLDVAAAVERARQLAARRLLARSTG